MPDASIHPDTTLGSVHLTVSDLDLSLPFYEQSLGFKVQRREGDTAALGAGEFPFLVLHEQPGARRVRGVSGLYHFAVLVPSRFELARSLKRIVETQTPVEGFADHLVSEAIYLPDPDGNGIEIYRDRSRDQWPKLNGKLRMASDPLDLDGLLGELEGHDEPWPGLQAGTRLGHMHLHIGDLRKATDFYTTAIGFDFIMTLAGSASFVSAGGYHHHLGLNTWAGVGAPPPPPDAVGLRWWEVVLPDPAELGKTADRIQTAGLKLEEREEGLFLRDPSQNGVLLTARDRNA